MKNGNGQKISRLNLPKAVVFENADSIPISARKTRGIRFGLFRQVIESTPMARIISKRGGYGRVKGGTQRLIL
jgi:hypothetical protein